jgi:lysozyme family protein
MSQASWPQIASWLDADEGGFVDDPRDPGGATNHGVTLRELAAYEGHQVTVADVRALSLTTANAILKTQYFDAVHGADLPSGLDYAVTDAAVNSGPVQAIKWLQAVLKISADGHWGVITSHAVSQIKPADVVALIDAYDRARLGFLQRLRTWPIFGKGWSNRVNRVPARAKILAAPKVRTVLQS